MKYVSPVRFEVYLRRILSFIVPNFRQGLGERVSILATQPVYQIQGG
jgi:hypothetical protein